MKSFQQRLNNFHEKFQMPGIIRVLDAANDWFNRLPGQFQPQKISSAANNSAQTFSKLLKETKSLGVTDEMEDFEKRKAGIFNQLNFFQVLTGLVVPVTRIFENNTLPLTSWWVACTPPLISLIVLWLNSQKKNEIGIIVYFILYPVVTSMVYMSGMNPGVDLFFILYGILSVFFLQQISHMLFSVSLTMISYFVLAVFWKDFSYEVSDTNLAIYLFNQALGIGFIFYGLFLIKKENSEYHQNIVYKNEDLQRKNIEIENQKREIAENAALLKKQTEELTELNSVKNKLFSVISHDLKTPMYALRNLFRHIQQHNMPAKEIKTIIPDVVNDLNYTTGLMENLLQWAKSQMQADNIRPQIIDISLLIEETFHLLHLQAEAKKIHTSFRSDNNVFISADRDMISLVLRNLVSNAIKFTPESGSVSIGVHTLENYVEIYVKDTGLGIDEEALEKLNQNNYYSTKGTASESGTGLGLMLCKEFLIKNGGQLFIESKPGNGSTFSFTLPLASEQ
jgi:two-component system sensor histidine kinase/response regulator